MVDLKFCPLGSTIAVATHDPAFFRDKIQILSSDTGEELAKLNLGYKKCTAVAFSPDGSILAAALQKAIIDGKTSQSGLTVNEFQSELVFYSMSTGAQVGCLKGDSRDSATDHRYLSYGPMQVLPECKISRCKILPCRQRAK